MSEIPIIAKVIISLVFLWMFAISVYLGSRVLDLLKRVKQLQDDKNELIKERAKQSNKLRLKGIEMDEENKKKFILSKLEKKMMLAALDMPEYGKAIADPKTSFQAKKAYRDLREKIKESLKNES